MARRRKRSSDYVHPQHWLARLRRALKIGWILLCLGALAGWWFGWGFVDGAGERIENRQFLDAIMGVIAFPGGLIWVWLAPLLEPFARDLSIACGLPRHLWIDYGPELLVWAGASLLGYVQWFWLLPYVFSLRSDG